MSKKIYLLVMCFIALVLLSSCLPTPTRTPQESAWVACGSFIQRTLSISFQDAHPYADAYVAQIAEGQYRTQVFFQKTLTTYQCIVQQQPDGTWKLLDLRKL